MSNHVLPRLGALAVAAVVGIAACTADGPTVPASSAKIATPGSIGKTISPASGGKIEICIDPSSSASATYTVTATRTPVGDFTPPSDSSASVDVFVGLNDAATSRSTTVTPNNCVNVLERFSTLNSNGAICWYGNVSALCPPNTAFAAGWATVTVTSSEGLTASWTCSPADPSTPSYCGTGLSGTGNTVRDGANIYHGAQTTFVFSQANPQFVVGDLAQGLQVGTAALKGNKPNPSLNFWGSQWWKNNPMSEYSDAGWPSFKGYATTAGTCGQTWTSRVGNSPPPPATIGEYVDVIVTNKVWKDGPDLSGYIKQIIRVHQDGRYGPNPGHDGNGPLTEILCTAQSAP